MIDTGAAAELRIILTKLDDKCGELAEVRKAEEDARRNNYHGNTVTEARERASAAASEFVKEAIDLQTDIDSLLRWKDYWVLVIERGL